MNILIFGDSITWGAYDPKQGGWANRLRNYFEEKDNDIIIYNLGICSDTTTDLLQRIETEAKSREPDLIIFAIGINDAQFVHTKNNLQTPPNEFKQNLQKLLSIANKFTNKVLFVGLTQVDESKTNPSPWDSDSSYLNKNIKQLDTIISDFCQTNHLKLIPMYNVINNEDLIDGLHPNTQGHIKMFDKIKSEIELEL